MKRAIRSSRKSVSSDSFQITTIVPSGSCVAVGYDDSMPGVSASVRGVDQVRQPSAENATSSGQRFRRALFQTTSTSFCSRKSQSAEGVL